MAGRPTDKERLGEAKYLLEQNGFVLHKNNEVQCQICGKYKSVQQNNFWQSFSPYYNGITAIYRDIKTKEYSEKEWTPVCKRCAEAILRDGEIDNAIELLQILDRPFIREVWNNTNESKQIRKPITVFGTYLKNVALNYKDLRFRDGEENTQNTSNYDGDFEPSHKKISKKNKEELYKFWGAFPDEDLLFLEDEYNDWICGYTIDTKSLKVLVKEICYKQLGIKKLRE